MNRDQGILKQRYFNDDCEVDLFKIIENPTIQYDIKDFVKKGFVDKNKSEVV